MPPETVIEDPTPLNPDYSSEELYHRTKLLQQLYDSINRPGQTMLLSAPQGAGKTAVLQEIHRNSERTTCYIPCKQFDTEYKALNQIYGELTDENRGSGHHVSELQREIQKQVPHQKPVIILDDVEFLLFNDDDSLLYYLSRVENNENLNLILSSRQTEDQLDLEERTRSSLQLRQKRVEPYTAEEAYQILAERARDSLKTRSLRREALSYIAATTQNITAALIWLRTAAKNTPEVITEDLVRNTRKTAYHSYAKHLLKDFSQHHYITFRALQTVLEEQEAVKTTSGEVYSQYQNLAETKKVEPLSERRISDHLKDLERLQLIESRYHYGGSKGKTREIRANPF